MLWVFLFVFSTTVNAIFVIISYSAVKSGEKFHIKILTFFQKFKLFEKNKIKG